MSYIDLHAHVLPGVDDGAETLEESLAMLRVASEHGTKALAVTPHGAGVTKTQYLGKFERLKAAAARESLPVKLFFGMEMMLWTERGAALQVTRSGIFGAFGRRAAETARVLLERDLVFCIASDGHGAAYRRPILEDVNAWLTERFGAAYAERLLHENPLRILYGEAGKERIA